MKIAMFTAEVRLDRNERIVAASLEKRDILEAAREFRSKYPGRRVRIESTLEEVSADGNGN